MAAWRIGCCLSIRRFHTLAPDRKDYERYLASARAQLDEAAWEAAWQEGQAMTLEQAVEYALNENQA
jgi:hypothetical protein